MIQTTGKAAKHERNKQMNTVYSYELKCIDPRISGIRHRSIATNKLNARCIILERFKDIARAQMPGDKVCWKDAIDSCELINEIKLDPLRVNQYDFPPENHTGYCSIKNGRMKKTFLHYEAAKQDGGIVVPRKIAEKMYA